MLAIISHRSRKEPQKPLLGRAPPLSQWVNGQSAQPVCAGFKKSSSIYIYLAPLSTESKGPGLTG